MSLLPFRELPSFQGRRFIPANMNLGDWSQVAPFFDQLEAHPAQCATVRQMEAWLVEWSELSAALTEEAGRRYIAMTCHTEDGGAQKAYVDFIEKILPPWKRGEFRLAQLFRNHPLRDALSRERYKVFERDTALTVELFREENVPLETEDAKLAQTYLEINGAMTVQFRGKERTLQEMSKFLEEPDRATRQEAWELDANRRLAEADKVESIFESMRQCRERAAANAGFQNYREYAWRRLRRFDYTPDQCVEFHSAIEREILPVVHQLQERRRRMLGVETLRPWDTEVDLAGRSPLRPFKEAREFVARTQRVFEHIDGELAERFQQLQDLRLLDLENRKGKAPGGYQVALTEARLPFIFLNAVGTHMDVLMLLHEAGHAFHTLATRAEPLLGYRSAPIEFCEVASLSMELIGSERLAAFYTLTNTQRARHTHFERMLESFPWIATVDAFQHWVYSHPGHTRSQRTDAWIALMDRFGGLVDWTGYETIRANLWHDVGHIFGSPFYFIEYGIAWVGALQVWAHWKRDPKEALAAYKRALGLGGSRPLPELFAAAGCSFDFSAPALRTLVQLICNEMEQL